MSTSNAVRPARESDVDAVVGLLEREIREGFAHFGTQPPPREQLLADLASPYPFVVADDAGQVRGFARASPWKSRGAYAWTAEVGVYVAPERHRSGLGRALVEDLLQRMRERGFRTVLAGIALPNPGSVGLFEKLGFRHAGTLPAVGWKLGAWRDVGYWAHDLGHGDPGPAPA
jgi:phosphinothricin acetyltransferase